MERYSLLGCCGLYCGGCRNFMDNNGEFKCHGCRDENELVSDCPTKACALGKGLLHCGECRDHPCEMLDKFYHDGARHHALALKNIRCIREIGPDSWMAEQEKEHACRCGKRRLWFDEECRHGT